MAPVGRAVCPAALDDAKLQVAEQRYRPGDSSASLDLIEGAAARVESCAVPLAAGVAAVVTGILVLLGLTIRGRSRAGFLLLAAAAVLGARVWPGLLVVAIYRVAHPGLDVLAHGIVPWPWPLAAQCASAATAALLARKLSEPPSSADY